MTANATDEVKGAENIPIPDLSPGYKLAHTHDSWCSGSHCDFWLYNLWAPGSQSDLMSESDARQSGLSNNWVMYSQSLIV